MQKPNSAVRDWSAVAFASFFPLVMAYLYFIVLDTSDDLDNPVVKIAYGAAKIVQGLFPAVFVCWFERERFAFVWPTWRGIPFAAGFGLLVAGSMFLLYFTWLCNVPAVSVEAPKMIWQRLIQFKQDTPTEYLKMTIFISLVHSLGEEYYWRWFVFGTMRRHVPLWVAIMLSSIGFMLHHVVILGAYFPNDFWTLALPFSLCVAFGGGVWAWLYERGGSLYAPWLSHAIIDTAIMGLGYHMLWEYWK